MHGTLLIWIGKSCVPTGKFQLFNTKKLQSVTYIQNSKKWFYPTRQNQSVCINWHHLLNNSFKTYHLSLLAFSQDNVAAASCQRHSYTVTPYTCCGQLPTQKLYPIRCSTGGKDRLRNPFLVAYFFQVSVTLTKKKLIVMIKGTGENMIVCLQRGAKKKAFRHPPQRKSITYIYFHLTPHFVRNRKCPFYRDQKAKNEYKDVRRGI